MFEGPTSFKTGFCTFYFYNQSSGLATAILLKFDEGYTHQDFLNTFTNGYSSSHAPSWTTHQPGAWEVIDPGTYRTWTSTLMPGLYAFLSSKQSPPGVGAYYGVALTVYEQ